MGRRRAENPSRVVLMVGVVGAVLLGAAAAMATSLASRTVASAERAEVASPATPVLSARRAPATLSLVTRTGRVARALESVGQMIPGPSCAAVSWKGTTMLARDVDAAMIPASSIKIITGAAALDLLGADFTYETAVHGSIDAAGNASDLFFVGGGDPVLLRGEYVRTQKYPTFAGTKIEGLVEALLGAGLRSVSGSIVGVDSRYDAQRWIVTWPASFRGVEAGPLGALMVNDGAVMGEKTKRDDPAVAAATELGNLLAARGVSLAGSAVHGVLPDGIGKIASVKSSPLSVIVRDMLTNSDNDTAELLLKEIGLVKKGAGTTQNGIAAVVEWLAAKGWSGGVQIFDGSGLSSQNRVPCSVYLSLLDAYKEVLPGSLAVAGESGTLVDTFDGQSVKGRLLGKTGTLTGVKALAGYVPVDGDEPVMFALLMNANRINDLARYRPVWYALGSAMGKASGVPSTEQLSP